MKTEEQIRLKLATIESQAHEAIAERSLDHHVANATIEAIEATLLWVLEDENSPREIADIMKEIAPP